MKSPFKYVRPKKYIKNGSPIHMQRETNSEKRIKMTKCVHPEPKKKKRKLMENSFLGDF